MVTCLRLLWLTLGACVAGTMVTLVGRGWRLRWVDVAPALAERSSRSSREYQLVDLSGLMDRAGIDVNFLGIFKMFNYLLQMISPFLVG